MLLDVSNILTDIRNNSITSLDLYKERLARARDYQSFANLSGHSDRVLAFAILPNSHIVSSSWDKTLRIWNASTLQCIAILYGHMKPVTALTILPNGNIVSGSKDKTLKVWDALTGQCLTTLHDALGEEIRALTTLPNGRIISGSWDNALKVWDLATSRCIAILTGHTASVRAITVLPEGHIVSGSLDKTLRIWDVNTGECRAVLTGHTDDINALAILPNGRIVSGSDDKTIRICDTDSSRCYAILEGHSSYVTALAILPNGHIISGSYDNTLRLWDMATGQCYSTLKGHTSHALAVLPDGRIVSGSEDKTLHLWDGGMPVLSFADSNAIIAALKSNHSIRALSFAHCYLKLNQLSAIADLLRTNSNIISLDLSDNAIADEGLMLLIDALSHNASLQSLNLERNPIGNACRTAINNLLSRNKQTGAKTNNEIITPEDWNTRGTTYFNEKNYQEALNCYEKAIKLDNLRAEYWSNKAVTLRELNSYADAIFSINQAIKIDSSKSSFWFRKGIILKKQGKEHEAFESNKKAAELGHPEAKAIFSQSRLKKIKYSNPELKMEQNRHNSGLARTALSSRGAGFTFQSPMTDEPNFLPFSEGLASTKVLTHSATTDKISKATFALAIPSKDLTFDSKDPIGRGGFGEVFKGTWRHEPVAIKRLLESHFSPMAQTEFMHEVDIMAKLRSDYIILLKGAVLDSQPYCLVMAWMDNGSLYDVLQSKIDLPWPLRLQIAWDISKGLAFLHHEEILHRDLKSLNILLDKHMQAKLSDFGMSKVKTETRSKSIVQTVPSGERLRGSLRWMAPELFGLRPKYSEKSDIYAYAIVAWEIATRKIPYAEVSSDLDIRESVKAGEREEIPESCHSSYANIISRGWHQDVALRPTANELVGLLKEMTELEAANNSSPSTSGSQTSTNSYKNNLASGLVSMTSYPSAFFSDSASSTSSNALAKQEKNNFN